MKKEIKILNRMKAYIEKVKSEKEAERLVEKQRILNLLDRSWTKEELDDYNESLIINSAGWIGGNYNEHDVKASILRDHADVFTTEEYFELYENMFPKEKTK